MTKTDLIAAIIGWIVNAAVIVWVIWSNRRDRKRRDSDYKKLHETLEKEYRKAIKDTHDIRDEYIKAKNALVYGFKNQN